jgi:hypothetical protein
MWEVDKFLKDTFVGMCWIAISRSRAEGNA